METDEFESEQATQPIVERRMVDSRLAYLERRQEKFEDELKTISDLLKTIKNTILVIGFILSPTSFTSLINFIGRGEIPQYQQPPPSYPYRETPPNSIPPRP
jgi:hypothetical protein